MQATQSSSASGAGSGSPQFAALRSVSRSLLERQSEGTNTDRAFAADGSGSRAAREGVANGAGLAHDVGNLLGALRLYADLIAMPGVLREEFRAYAEELHLLSERSKELVAQLMQHAGTDRSQDRAERLVLPHVVEQCHGLLCHVAGHAVETGFGSGSRWPVMAPAASVERILTNLVKNAGEALLRKASDNRGEDRKIRVTVEATVESGSPRLVLTVADSGCGMTEQELLALEEGMRLTRSGAGRGLGLRVVRELAALSGAGVRIESRVGVGTSVMVEWEGIAQREGERPIRLVEAEAGWIAC